MPAMMPSKSLSFFKMVWDHSIIQFFHQYTVHSVLLSYTSPGCIYVRSLRQCCWLHGCNGHTDRNINCWVSTCTVQYCMLPIGSLSLQAVLHYCWVLMPLQLSYGWVDFASLLYRKVNSPPHWSLVVGRSSMPTVDRRIAGTVMTQCALSGRLASPMG